MMTRRSRRLLLIGLIVLFALLAPVVVLISLGYRFDTETFGVFKTGAMTIKTEPGGAMIVLDGKERGVTPKTIRWLFPRNYRIRLEVAGYHRWEKTLRVRPSLVTEATNVVLPPLSLPLERIGETAYDRVAVTPSGRYVAGYERDKRLLIYRLTDSGEIAASVVLPQGIADNERFVWAPGERRLLIVGNDEATAVLFDTTPPRVVTVSGDVQWSTTDSALLRRVPISPSLFSVRSISLAGGAITTFPHRAVDVLATPEGIFARRENPSRIERWNAVGEVAGDAIPLRGDVADPAFQFHFASDARLFIVRHAATHAAWVYVRESDRWFDLGPEVDAVAVAPDGRRLAAVHRGGTVEVTWLFEDDTQPLRQPGDRDVPITDAAVASVQWLPGNNYYLVFVSGNDIGMTELDGRGGDHNRWNLLSLRNPAIDTFPGNPAMIIVSGGAIYRTSFDGSR